MKAREEGATGLRERARRWLIATWIAGGMVAASVVLGLAAAIAPLNRTLELTEEPMATSEQYTEAIDASLAWTRIGIVLGTVTFGFYLFSYLRYQQCRRRLEAEARLSRIAPDRE